jgi:hypothetical protein
MKQNTDAVEGTTVSGNHGIDYEFDRVSGTAVIWVHHNDGSRGSVWLDEDYELEKVDHSGPHDTVGIQRTYNDGSTRYNSIPTELYNQIESEISHLLN